MSLWKPRPSCFTWQKSNVEGLRPAAAWGTSITPSATANTKGSWVECISAANLTADVCLMLITISNVAVAATATDCVVDIGVDPAGGTSYSVLIPDLLASCAGAIGVGGGINYTFPIWVKAGSSIAARAAQNRASASAFSVAVTVFGKPDDPKHIKVGSFVTSFGVGASSNGTAVTSGTTSEGAYTQLGSATTKDHWWWQLGMGINDSTMANGGVYAADVAYGDATNKHLIIQDQYFSVTTANESLCSQGACMGCERAVKTGANIYGRLQCSGTADSALSLAAYGVGG